ncbi:MAG: oligoendopeptidase F [Bacteroidetes bacterium]|nr:oligoendopeptidase F [Bacteroidota bacterium]
MKNYFIIILTVIIMTSITVEIKSQQYQKRSDIPEKYKWNLKDFFESNYEWQESRKEIEDGLPKLKMYKGKLGESSETLYNALANYTDLRKKYYKLLVYAYRLGDEDLNISENQELVQQTSSLGTQFSEASSYITPELLAIDPEIIEKYINEKAELNEYKFFIESSQRLREHTLSDAEESLLATAGMLRSNNSSVYNIFDNAEKPNSSVTLSNGEQVTVDAAGFSRWRGSSNREDRKNVMEANFESYEKFKNTFGANLAGKLKTDWFFAKTRKYNSTLESSLDGNNIPISVYENLITQVNKNLPALHRFLDLKKKMLGVDTLHYFDLYAPLVENVELNYTVDEGQNLLLEVFKPLGEEYVNTVKKSFDNRWIDYYPTPGKRSGAYSHGAAYDIHPVILMNWTDDYNSVSTLAHELGHTMHSYFSNTNQPFVNAGYATFVAEIASTINENFLNDYMVENAKTEKEKLFLLGSYLDLLRATIFRQTSFAEFELEIHKKIENNEPLTGQILSDIYYNIVKKYYGHDNGACVVDDYIQYEWAYIPHFLNYTYYVFQYSTSLIYATGISEKIKAEGQPAIDNYYKILKGGGSDYPVNLVKKAGIDPLGSEAFDITIKRMNDVMDQIEEILAKK